VLSATETCHRIGGGDANNLKLWPAEEKLVPPGFSVLIGGTPKQAAADFRRVFGSHSSLGKKAATVGTTAIGKVRDAGFDVIEDPTTNFRNHGRLIHPTDGAAGFNDANRTRLAAVFTNKTGL
jgi:hypothetical protein